MNRKGFEFSFGWMFAIIVGAVIIALTTYTATRFVYTERKTHDSEIAQQLSTLLSPLETGIEEAKTSKLNFPQETRVYNGCSIVGNFGSQKISVETKSGIGKEWQGSGVNSTTYNKYVFSSKSIEGKEMTILSKPFNMPFRIGTLIFMWGEEDRYCFVNPPNEIREELEDTLIRNNMTRSISVVENPKQCKKGDRKVCFSEGGCEIDVSIATKSLKKNKQVVHYEGSLIYGAIFADPAIYECQVQRLMKRASEMALVYMEKSKYISSKGGCSSNMQADLANFAKTVQINSTREIGNVYFASQALGEKNDNLVSCKLWSEI